MPRGSEYERATIRCSLGCLPTRFLRPSPQGPLNRRSHAKPPGLPEHLSPSRRTRGGTRGGRGTAHRAQALRRRRGGAARHRPRRGAALAACTCRDRLPRRGRGALDARGRHRPDRRGGRRVVAAVHRRGEAADAPLRTCGRSSALYGGAGGGGGGARPLWGRRRARTDRGGVPRARPGGRCGRRGCARRTAAAPRRRLERRERPALALRRPRRCVRERRAPGGDLGALSSQCVHPDRGVRRRGRTPRGRRLRAGLGEVEVSENEWAKACNLRDGYWLYVVFDCATPRPRLVRVRDPFGRLLATAKGSVVIAGSEILSAATDE